MSLFKTNEQEARSAFSKFTNSWFKKKTNNNAIKGRPSVIIEELGESSNITHNNPPHRPQEESSRRGL